MGRVTLILGGARSGKSARAVALARPPRVFLATAEALDGEMADRIALHKAGRAPDWGLDAAPLEIVPAIAAETTRTVVVDCLTLWLSNLMHDERDIEAESAALVAALADVRDGAHGDVILVSNEVGLATAPENGLARRFRDAQGRLNQSLAARADLVLAVMAGLPLVLKGTLPEGAP